MKYIYTLLLVITSYFWRIRTYFYLLCKTKKFINSNTKEPHLIVSLTSYGRRVRQCAQYAIMSIFMQKGVIIDKVLLALDKDNWNQDNLPWAIKKLSQLGLEILYVEDIKSYTKLLPALSLYPNSVIVTIDDDIHYSTNLIKELYKAHKMNPQAIISTKAKMPKTIDGKLIVSYKEWAIIENKDNCPYLFPMGYGGVLYPPKALNSEVFNNTVFSKLAPTADDLWFWIMSLLAGTKHTVIDDSKIILYPIDLIYQYFYKNSTLAHDNIGKNKNDEQLQLLIDYYKINLTDNLPK